MSTATQVSKKWQGQKIDGRFTLRQELGGSDHSAVFLTERSDREPRTAAIKLIPSSPHEDDARLARWAAAAKLDHPHLMRLFESGRCELDGARYLFVVMEYAEEDLSQILPQRPLTAEEASDVLQPTAEALAYLHGAGFVHGHIRPSNILAVDNHLKLSADGLRKQGEAIESHRLTVYDAPEVSAAGLSPEADVWSLGVTLVTTLTQYPPDFTNANPPQAIVPETVPQPLREIARTCLMSEPRQRCTVADIQKRLQAPAPRIPEKVAATPANKSSKRSMVLPAVIVIVVLAILGVRAFLTRQPALPPPADHAAQPVAAPIAKSSPAPVSPAQNQAKGTVRGKLANQVLPNVSHGARNTITGKVKVNVEVSVDASGKVSAAKIVNHVESKYFTRLALESARQSTFIPPQVDDQPVASVWTIRYLFGRTGTQMFPTELRP